MCESSVDELICEVVKARKTYPAVIAKCCEEKSKIYIKHLQNLKVETETRDVEITVPKNPLEITRIGVEDMPGPDGVNNLIKKMQEQIKLMELLVEKKHSPINQIIDANNNK